MVFAAITEREDFTDIPRFSPLTDDNAPFDSKEFDAGYLARLFGEPQCLGATRGSRGASAKVRQSLSWEVNIHRET